MESGGNSHRSSHLVMCSSENKLVELLSLSENGQKMSERSRKEEEG